MRKMARFWTYLQKKLANPRRPWFSAKMKKFFRRAAAALLISAALAAPAAIERKGITYELYFPDAVKEAYPNSAPAALNINDLKDVSVGAATTGQCLKKQATNWTAGVCSTPGQSGFDWSVSAADTTKHLTFAVRQNPNSALNFTTGSAPAGWGAQAYSSQTGATVGTVSQPITATGVVLLSDTRIAFVSAESKRVKNIYIGTTEYNVPWLRFNGRLGGATVVYNNISLPSSGNWQNVKFEYADGSFAPAQTGAATNHTLNKSGLLDFLDLPELEPTKENIYPAAKAVLKAGDNITITPSDANNELTIASTAMSGGGGGTVDKASVYTQNKAILKQGTDIGLVSNDTLSEITISNTRPDSSRYVLTTRAPPTGIALAALPNLSVIRTETPSAWYEVRDDDDDGFKITVADNTTDATYKGAGTLGSTLGGTFGKIEREDGTPCNECAVGKFEARTNSRPLRVYLRSDELANPAPSTLYVRLYSRDPDNPNPSSADRANYVTVTPGTFGGATTEAQYVTITPSTTNFPTEGWGSKGWGRRVSNGNTFFGTLTGTLNSDIVGVTNSYLVTKATTSPRYAKAEYKGTEYSLAGTTAWNGTWGGQDRGLVVYQLFPTALQTALGADSSWATLRFQRLGQTTWTPAETSVSAQNINAIFGTKGWARHESDGATARGSITNETTLDSNILAILDKSVVVKRAFPLLTQIEYKGNTYSLGAKIDWTSSFLRATDAGKTSFYQLPAALQTLLTADAIWANIRFQKGDGTWTPAVTSGSPPAHEIDTESLTRSAVGQVVSGGAVYELYTSLDSDTDITDGTSTEYWIRFFSKSPATSDQQTDKLDFYKRRLVEIDKPQITNPRNITTIRTVTSLSEVTTPTEGDIVLLDDGQTKTLFYYTPPGSFDGRGLVDEARTITTDITGNNYINTRLAVDENYLYVAYPTTSSAGTTYFTQSIRANTNFFWTYRRWNRVTGIEETSWKRTIRVNAPYSLLSMFAFNGNLYTIHKGFDTSEWAGGYAVRVGSSGYITYQGAIKFEYYDQIIRGSVTKSGGVYLGIGGRTSYSDSFGVQLVFQYQNRPSIPNNTNGFTTYPPSIYYSYQSEPFNDLIRPPPPGENYPIAYKAVSGKLEAYKFSNVTNRYQRSLTTVISRSASDDIALPSDAYTNHSTFGYYLSRSNLIYATENQNDFANAYSHVYYKATGSPLKIKAITVIGGGWQNVGEGITLPDSSVTLKGQGDPSPFLGQDGHFYWDEIAKKLWVKDGSWQLATPVVKTPQRLAKLPPDADSKKGQQVFIENDYIDDEYVDISPKSFVGTQLEGVGAGKRGWWRDCDGGAVGYLNPDLPDDFQLISETRVYVKDGTQTNLSAIEVNGEEHALTRVNQTNEKITGAACDKTNVDYYTLATELPEDDWDDLRFKTSANTYVPATGGTIKEGLYEFEGEDWEAAGSYAPEANETSDLLFPVTELEPGVREDEDLDFVAFDGGNFAIENPCGSESIERLIYNAKTTGSQEILDLAGRFSAEVETSGFDDDMAPAELKIGSAAYPFSYYGNRPKRE